jgi:hypothetical protein
VLVIIGLIIGGILKGQEIIESSRSKNVLSEIERLRAATNTFFDRYKALPGDFALAQNAAANVARITTSAQVVNGNGDGVVNAASVPVTAATIGNLSGGAAGAAGTAENVPFFTHLAAAKLIGGVTVSSAAQTSFGEGSAVPSAAFPGTGFTLMYGSYNDVAGAELTGHWMRIHKGTPQVPAAGLLAKQLQSIDVRIDDGLPANGGVRTGIPNAPCGTLTIATADYQPTVESVSCIALINLVQ